MKEGKNPRKPLMFYYLVVMVVMMVLMSTFVCVNMPFDGLMVFMSVSAVIVPELSCAQSSNEDGETYEHSDALPAEMSFLAMRTFMASVFSFIMAASVAMDHISVGTVGLCSASAVLMLAAVPSVYPVIYHVGGYSDDYSQYEKYRKQYERLLRKHRQHHERFVA